MFYDLIESVNAMMEAALSASVAKKLTNEQRNNCAIDPRALRGDVWYDDDALVIKVADRAVLDYYGGFEYVDKHHVTQLGDYVLYSGEAERVRDLLDSFV